MSTSYNEDQLGFITSLVKVIDPKTVFEIGAQQGHSAIALGMGMWSNSKLVTCDRFEEKYPDPPYAATHASMAETIKNLEAAGLQCDWQVTKCPYQEELERFPEGKIDLIHIDICNHFDNIQPILEHIFNKEYRIKLILLEGGVHNHWQKKHGFDCYTEAIEPFWDRFITIPFDENHAITIVTPEK